MNPVTHVGESCHTHDQLCQDLLMIVFEFKLSLITATNESRHTCGRVTSHRQACSESCHTHDRGCEDSVDDFCGYSKLFWQVCTALLWIYIGSACHLALLPCNAMQYTSSRYATRHHLCTAVRCNMLQHTAIRCNTIAGDIQRAANIHTTLQHVATRYNTPQDAAT